MRVEPWNLLQGEVSCSDPVLNPEVGGREVANAPQPAPTTYSDGCCGIRLDFEGPCEAKVAGYWDEPQRRAGTLADPAEFCLSRREGHYSLCDRPVFYEVLTSPAQAARGAPPCEDAPRETSVGRCDKLINHWVT